MGMIDFDRRATTARGSAPAEFDGADLEPIRERLATLGRPHTPADVADAMRAEGLVVSDSSVIETVESLRRNSIGAGALDGLLRLPGVTDVLVNGPDQVFVDRGAGLELTEVRFGSDAEVRRLAQRLAASVGRRLDDSSPVRRRAARRRLPSPRGTGCGCGARHLHLAPGAGHPHLLPR